MFGSDSAPHPKHAKESCGCAAGVFTAPIALQVLAELFENENAPLENLQAFISGNAQNIYGVTPLVKTVTLEKKEFTVLQIIMVWFLCMPMSVSIQHQKVRNG